MAFTGGYRLTKGQEGSSKDISCNKDFKNECKLETSRQQGWLIGPFMISTFNVTAKDLLHSLDSCLEQLEVCMGKPDTFQIERTFLLHR